MRGNTDIRAIPGNDLDGYCGSINLDVNLHRYVPGLGRNTTRLLAALAAVSALVGCSNSEREQTGSEIAPSAESTTPLDTESGDLAGFLSSKEDFLSLVDVAVWNGARSCMESQGFQLPLRQPVAAQPSLPYGLPEDGDASRGFHLAQPAGDTPVEEPPLSAQAQEALSNPDAWEVRSITLPSGEAAEVVLDGGCLGASREAIFGGAEPYFETMTAFHMLQDLGIAAAVEAQGAPEMLQLNASWAACMTNAGFSFDNPLAAWDFAWPSGPTPDEIAAAQADIQCKQSTSYTNSADAIVNRIANLKLENNAGLLERWTELSEEVVARALSS